MTAIEIIELARNGELKQLSIKSDDNAILGFINLGVLELYKRFPLREAEAIITMREGKTLYKLDGSDPDVSMEPDTELLVISGAYVYNECDQCAVFMDINNEDDLLGINTPTYNTVEIPAPMGDYPVSIIYRVAPPFLTNVNDVVPIPPQLLEALLNYIGYRGHGSINGELKTENQSHYLRFENSCKRVMANGLITTDDIITKKFYDRGFV